MLAAAQQRANALDEHTGPPGRLPHRHPHGGHAPPQRDRRGPGRSDAPRERRRPAGRRGRGAARCPGQHGCTPPPAARAQPRGHEQIVRAAAPSAADAEPVEAAGRRTAASDSGRPSDRGRGRHGSGRGWTGDEDDAALIEDARTPRRTGTTCRRRPRLTDVATSVRARCRAAPRREVAGRPR